MKKLKRNRVSGAALLGLALIVCLFSGLNFLTMHDKEEVFPSPSLTETRMLSFYFPGLLNTAGDTEVYVFRGEEKAGNLLIMGGTHPNEPAGFITAVLLIENIAARRGNVIIIPRANSSGFTHSDPQEGNPQRFELKTRRGKRSFRLGSRLTNPVDQWPDPTVYINPAGQRLSSMEIRNLNRCYPGRKNGYLTEKIAYGVMELIKKEEIDLGLDLHESAPEYPVINAVVFHENSSELAGLAVLQLEEQGFEFRLEASPQKLRGLSHREWGDHAGIQAILLETPNVSQGRLKGRPSSALVVDGKDKYYVRASELGRLFVPYRAEGIPLSQRVARHLASIRAILDSLEELKPEKKVEIDNIPSAAEVMEKGVGCFLRLKKG